MVQHYRVFREVTCYGSTRKTRQLFYGLLVTVGREVNISLSNGCTRRP